MSVQRCPKTGSGQPAPGRKRRRIRKTAVQEVFEKFLSLRPFECQPRFERPIWLDQLIGKRLAFLGLRSAPDRSLRRLPNVEHHQEPRTWTTIATWGLLVWRCCVQVSCWSPASCSFWVRPMGQNRRRLARQARKSLHRVLWKWRRRSTVRLPISDEGITETWRRDEAPAR